MNRHFDKDTGRMAQIGITQQVKIREQKWATPSANKTTKSGEIINSDGTAWDGLSKPHSKTTGKPIQTALSDQVAINTGNKQAIIPRVATGIKSRADRLKAIGNGQVPQVAAMAWNILNQPKP